MNVELPDEVVDAAVVVSLKEEWENIAEQGILFDDVDGEQLLNALLVVLRWYMSDADYTKWRSDWWNKQREAFHSV